MGGYGLLSLGFRLYQRTQNLQNSRLPKNPIRFYL